jgi:hypothetical protein
MFEQRLRGIAKTKDIINLCLNEASTSIRAALSLEVSQVLINLKRIKNRLKLS